MSVASPNGFDGLASLSVTGVPGGIQASFKPLAITSGQTAILTLSAPASQSPSSATLSVSASASIQGQAVSQSGTVGLQIVRVTTSFIGRTVVDDTQETPIAGVTVKFLGKDNSGNVTGCSGQTTSDAGGNFALTNLASNCVGPQLISYDGSTATSPVGKYAGVNLWYPLASGQVTTSPVLIHLPRIDNAETVQVQQNAPTNQLFTFQSMPGLLVTVYAGTKFSLDDGSQPNPFPLTAIDVPVDRLPDKMPPSSMVVPFIVAFQPANAVSSQPVAVDFPNLLNLAPGGHATLMTLDPTRGFMVPYGTGTVSNNGSQVLPDADPSHPGHSYGLIHFDWHGPAQIPPKEKPCPECVPPPPGASCSGPCARTSSPIDLSSGLEVIEETDISVNGTRGSIPVVRTYRTLSTNPGPFGIGTSLNYAYQLDSYTPQSASVVNLFFPDGSAFPFTRNAETGDQLTNDTVPALLGAVMTTNSDNTTDLRWKDGTVWHFIPIIQIVNSGSFLSSITDSNGNVTTITWSSPPQAQITQVTDPAGRNLTFIYDGLNRIMSITDPIGRKVQYGYNPQGMLASVTDPAGAVTQYTYDSQNRLTKITDAREIVTVQNTYDANGRVSQQTAADGGVTQFTYFTQDDTNPDSPILGTVVTDPMHNTTGYRFDPNGYLLAVTDATFQTRSFTRQPGTNLVTGISGTGLCPICGDPRSGNQNFTFDANGNLTSITDALGNKTSYTYNPIFNKVTSIEDPLGNTTSFVYDSKGNLKTITDPKQQVTTFTYDAFGELTQITDALNQNTLIAYDSLGNLTSVTDPLGNRAQTAYDGISRPVQIIDAIGRRSTITYDEVSRIKSQTDPQNNTTQFAYDKVGNLFSVTDAKGNETSFTYDGVSRLLTKMDPLHHADTRTYDYNGNLMKFLDRRNQTSQFGYDSLNRLTRESYQGGSTVSRLYDANSRLLNATDSTSGSFDFSYDADGRLLSSANQFGSVDYTYDQASRLKSRQAVGQSAVQYTYDAASNLQSAAMPQASANFIYDPDDRLSRINRANGVSSLYSYDHAGNLLSIVHSGGSGVNIPLTYTYDPVGNRLTQATSVGHSLITQAATSTYNNDNQLVSSSDASGATRYLYDLNGNLVSSAGPSGMTTYTWDTRNRLTSITESNGPRTNLLNDFGINLLQQTDSGPMVNLTQQFVLDQLANVAYLNRSNGDNLSVLNGTGIDLDLAVAHSIGQIEYALKDGINTSVGTTNQAGVATGQFSYEPFGQTAASGTTYPFQFTGRTPVSTNLYYYRARFYNSTSGRFISEDPIGLLGGDVNFYRYASGAPTLLTDPLGLVAPQQSPLYGTVNAQGQIVNQPYNAQQAVDVSLYFAGLPFFFLGPEFVAFEYGGYGLTALTVACHKAEGRPMSVLMADVLEGGIGAFGFCFGVGGQALSTIDLFAKPDFTATDWDLSVFTSDALDTVAWRFDTCVG